MNTLFLDLNFNPPEPLVLKSDREEVLAFVARHNLKRGPAPYSALLLKFSPDLPDSSLQRPRVMSAQALARTLRALLINGDLQCERCPRGHGMQYRIRGRV